MIRVPVIACGCLSLLLAGAAAGPLLLPDLRPPGTTLDARLFYWDACWYDEIAGIGYQWRWPAMAGRYSDVAFFPLYALVDWAVIRLGGRSGATYLILPGVAFGFWSIIEFHRLARIGRDAGAARWATLCFGLWPGACFLLMGYPTGLINLCVVKALRDTVAGRRWRGAGWCGLGTAAGPAAVFVAAALCLDRAAAWARDGAPRRALPELVGYGALTIGGLLGFMGYLTARFGDPLLFVTAQLAWIAPMPWPRHLAQALDPLWFVARVMDAAAPLARFLAAPEWHGAAARLAVFQFQQVLTFAGLVLAIGALVHASRGGRPGVIALAGWLVVAGYVWFMGSTSAFLVDGPRMLYPAVAVMLAAGDWAAASAVARLLLVGGFAVLAVLEAALVAAGYPVN